MKKQWQKFIAGLLAAGAAAAYGGTNYTWTGSAGDGDWSNSVNWVDGFIPGTLSLAYDQDTITFDGDNLPTSNLAAFEGNWTYYSAVMNFNSGGDFTLDMSTSFDGGPAVQESMTWLTVGDGVGGGTEDAAVTLTNLNYAARGGKNCIVDYTVNSDGTLYIYPDLDLYGDNNKYAHFTLNGGAVVCAGALDTAFDNQENSFFEFTAEGGSLTAAFGGSYTNLAQVEADAGGNFQPAPGLELAFSSNAASFTVSAVLEPLTAVINVSTNSGIIPLEIAFDGSGSVANYGGTIVSYGWDLGDGTTASGDTVVHSYGSAGEYTATLTVIDDRSYTNSASVVISASGPSAVIGLIPDTDNSSTPLLGSMDNLLNDAFAYDPLDPTSDWPSLVYSDGFHGKNTDGSDVILSFTLSNAFTTVSDSPVIAMDMWGRDSNQDRDDDIDVILYSGDYSNMVGWVEGIAIPDGSEPYARAEINMLAVGTTFDRVQIIGHNSTSGTDNPFTLTEVRLINTSGDIVPITPVLNTSTNSGYLPLEIDFDASGSVVHNEPATYSWDFGNGDADSRELVSYTYEEPGTFTAVLTIVDALDNTNSASTEIVVESPIVPVINVSTNLAQAPASIDFAGTNSWARDGIASYEWDFGDGGTASGDMVSHLFDEGTYTVTLTVIDTAGLSNSVTTTVLLYNLPDDVVYTTVKYHEDDENNTTNAPSVSMTDLGQTAFLSITNEVNVYPGYDPAELFNGAVSNACYLQTDASFTLVFDTSVNMKGYDIYGIDTVFGSGTYNGGRANQGYSVTVTYMDDTTEKILGKKTWEENLDPTEFWTRVSFTNTLGSAMAVGVKAVTFAEFDPCNVGVGGDFIRPREFDIFGTPSDGTEGPTLSLTNGTALVWFSPNVKEYEIQYCDNLTIKDWNTYTNITSTPPETTVELPMGRDGAEFFRVVEP